MRFHHLAFVLILTLVVCTIAEKPHKRKKFRRIMAKTTSTESSPAEVGEGDDEFKLMEKDEEFEKAAEIDRENQKAKQAAIDTPPDALMNENRVELPNVCKNVHCGAGRICTVDENNEPKCDCVETCPVEIESRRKVCSVGNKTWPSDCAVYQQRCWCDKGDERCEDVKFKHLHIEYYGECRDMPECAEGEMADFPRRMRDWLFNVMRDLADRQELPEYYMKMEREAETNLTLRWANAAIWKWCDLDGHPHDRSVSRHELFPIRAPLMALEHCIAPFLDSCDSDNDHRITLKEWAKCLELNEDEIDDRCEEIEDEIESV